MAKKIGLIVNPVAGMGGRVGLKGSDGQEIIRKAKELGAVAMSPGRAVEALRELAPLRDGVEIVAYPHEMGEDEAREAGFEPTVIGSVETGKTTSEDTRRAAREMLSLGVDLILFAGGDGTAKDVYEAVDEAVPVLGIPAGVKIHSAVYAINPSSAGRLAVNFLAGEAETRESEVVDIDEEAFRENRLSARLYGYLTVPYEKTLVQGSKESSSAPEEFFLESIAADIVEGMEDGVLYIIGPGSTTKAITDKLGLEKTLLGVDVVQGKVFVANDVNETKLLELVRGRRAKIVVTVIGGQGFIFGRGNQQISPTVIRVVGKENVIVVATPGKLSALGGRPLLVDTGDAELDAQLSGYVRVINGYGRRVVYRVRSR